MEGYNLLMTIFTYEISTFDKPDQYVEDPSQPVLTLKFDYAEHHRYCIYSSQDQIESPIHVSIKKEQPHVKRFTLSEFKSNEDGEWLGYLYDALDSLNVKEQEDQDEIVDKIIEEFNKEIETLGSDNDRKILALSVDMKLTHFMVCQRELVARELRKRMLKRARVVKDEEIEENQYRERRKRRKIVGESESCSICLEEFVTEKDGVFCMPCSHAFHGKECIEKWLRENDDCPICRFHLHVSEE